MQRAKADAKKEEQERLTKILLDMLKEEENKYCADCQAKTPRWAAWNLGIFICIRCAGIHRNLGVHISKVRSVNLDSWTPEQVQSMRVMGNEKARKVYEAKLPEGFRRSMADHQLEQFIRGKYEQKRYILPDFVYPRIDVSELPKTGQPTTKKTPTAIFSKTPLSSVTPSSPGHISSVKSAPQIADLLDFSAPAAAHSGGGGADSLIGDLASIDIQTQPSSQSADLDDMFGSFVSAPAAPSSASSAAPPSGGDFFSSMPSTVSPTTPTAAATSPNGNGISNDLMGLSVGGGADDEKRTNADILALFGGAGQQQTQQISAPGGFSAFGIQAAPAQQQQQQQQQQNQFAAFGAPAPQQHQQFGGLHQQFQMPMGQPQIQTQFGGFGGQPMAATNPANFPNPFGPPGVGAPLGAGFAMTAPAAPATQSMQGFSTGGGGGGRANNAFADLSIGKVMSSYKNPKAATAMTSSTPNNNATTTSQPADMNFDDLLGL